MLIFSRFNAQENGRWSRGAATSRENHYDNGNGNVLKHKN